MIEIKKFIKKNKNRIYISIDMGFLFIGIFMLVIGSYSPICGLEVNSERMALGAFCIGIWFFLFPAINREEKDKIANTLGAHLLAMLFILIILGYETDYFFNNMEQGNFFNDLIFCVGGLAIFSYFIYVFGGFLKTFFYLVEKLKKFIFPKLQEVSGTINIIQTITTGILAITAFGASIVGFITLIKQFQDLF